MIAPMPDSNRNVSRLGSSGAPPPSTFNSDHFMAFSGSRKQRTAHKELPPPLLATLWLAQDRFRRLAILTALALLPLSAVAQDPAREFLADIARQASSAEQAGRSVLTGNDGWLFFVPELRSLSAGPFWGNDATRVSRSAKPENADPLPAIVDFHRQLQGAGIELLLVPVPAKTAIYPDRLSQTVKPDQTAASPRLDPSQRAFYDVLSRAGMTVVDLAPTFQAQRDAPPGPLYCRTDSHWSGRGLALAAQRIAEHVRQRDWLLSLPKQSFVSETRNVEFTGDLARILNEQQPVRETLPLTFVGLTQQDLLVPQEPDRNSPVLLIGDSHTLVFHDATLYAKGAGLPDHLALQLGIPVDLVGIRGSGATTTRIELLRRKDNLRGKKLVIWCFSFREFTEGAAGWRKVPVIR
jgi:hypothetical protein